MRGIRRQHVLTNGWSDIGYNFVIDVRRRTYEGRWARAYRTVTSFGTHPRSAAARGARRSAVDLVPVTRR